MTPEIWEPPPGETLPKAFVLIRSVDQSGISGTGLVAEGVEFSDGTAAIRWRGEHASTVLWSDLHDALAIHGHNGDTRIEYL